MTSVLARAASLTLETDPFPHLLIDNALDPDVYASLAAQFPAADVINRKGRPVRNNHLYLMSAPAVEADPRIAQEWKEFFRYQIGRASCRERV